MPFLQLDLDRAENPLDIIERIAAHNRWSFDRDEEDEISISVAGGWSEYNIAFTWLAEVEALHVACAFDLKVPAARLTELASLVSLINEQLWIGHFDIWPSDGVIMFRHAILLAGGAELNGHQCQTVLASAVRACERYATTRLFNLSSLPAKPVPRRSARSCLKPKAGLDMEAPGVDRFDASLVLAGAGKMGGVMLRAWLGRGYDPRKISVIEPRPSPEIIELAQAAGFALAAPSRPPEILVLAMKPQNLDEAAAGLAPFAGPDTLVVSILAGKTIANIAARFPHATAIVRAMPNLAAAVGRGMAALVANAAATPGQRATAEVLLAAAGRVEWLAGEDLIDAATAVSGSGSAYVFYLTEALASAGAALGLPAGIAARLARATVEGAGELLFQCPESSVAELRENVTSRGGTTAAALEVLMAQDGLTPLIERAAKAAKQRAAELSG